MADRSGHNKNGFRAYCTGERAQISKEVQVCPSIVLVGDWGVEVRTSERCGAGREARVGACARLEVVHA